MRTITLLIILIFFLAGYSQEVSKNIHIISEDDVPFEILETQEELYPFHLVSEWQLHRENRNIDSAPLRYIGTIAKDGNSKSSASYSPDGTLLFKSEIILPVAIPQDIKLDIKKKHPKFKIQSAELITLTFPMKEIYWINLLNEGMLQYVFYDASSKEIEKKDLPMELMMLFR